MGTVLYTHALMDACSSLHICMGKCGHSLSKDMYWRSTRAETINIHTMLCNFKAGESKS